MPSFASILRWVKPGERPLLVDPCAGEGEAILALRRLWAASYGAREPLSPYEYPETPQIAACELEAGRFEVLARALSARWDAKFHGDAFQLTASGKVKRGASVLWLNPPYDTDKEHGRLEQRFLARFTPHLTPGGFLFFLVPFYALAASAEFLARHYRELRAWRLPEPEWNDFRQVILVGRATAVPVSAEFFRHKIARWAEHPEELPELAETCSDPYEVHLGYPGAWNFEYTLESLDLAGAVASFAPFAGSPLGIDQPVADLLGARFETAMPPKPAHIALALASGMFNGQRLYPNHPKRHPAVLAKGTFQRRYTVLSEKHDKDGNLTGVVELELPELELTVLRLDTGEFLSLAPGAVPSGSQALERWNVADLITHYDRSLAEVMAGQFPSLHNPADLAGRVHLPALARKPFQVQSDAVQAMLKLVAKGRNPFLIGEVGTGKSTMALMVAASLAPAHHAETTAQLNRLGFTGRLPVVRRTLIFCPPHLLKSWSDQVHAVVPSAKVVILKRLSDLDQDGDFFVLSREAAKLGPGFRGHGGRCRGCGAPIEQDADTNAQRRLRCPAEVREPANLAARFLLDLAVPLAIAAPASQASVYLRGFLLGRLGALLDGEPRSISSSALYAILRRLFQALAREIRRAEPQRQQVADVEAMLPVLVGLARALGLGQRVADGLAPIATGTPFEEAVGDALIQLLAPISQEEADRPLVKRIESGVLTPLEEAARWEVRPCREPLFACDPTKARRYPLAKAILRRHRRKFDLFLMDEAHEANHSDSAQSKAAHRLARLPGVPTLVLTGSLMGGYASHLFTNMWSLSPTFRKEFEHDGEGPFVARYGFRKMFREAAKDEGSARRRGASSDRDLDGRKVIGEAPGVMPTFITRYLLPQAVFVHKAELDQELPPCREVPVPIEGRGDGEYDEVLFAQYQKLERQLMARIKKDRFTQLDGRLFGAMGQLTSYLDRATDDLPPFVLAYPDSVGGMEVARARMLPAHYRTPKERWLVAKLRQSLEDGEKVLLFLSHTGSAELPSRIVRMVREVAPSAVFLDTKKVPAATREAWIDEQVIATGAPVLVVNPNGVRTGLNNLVAFSTAIWYELDLSALTYRQANGRLHRIGQSRAVTIYVPFYEKSSQEIAFELLAQKVSASLKVDGLDLTAALEAAGASDATSDALASVMGMGQAIYQRLLGGEETPATKDSEDEEPKPAPLAFRQPTKTESSAKPPSRTREPGSGRPRFPLGQVVATPGALRELTRADIDLALYRHQRADWGDVDPSDAKANDQAVKAGNRILSAYQAGNGTRFWIITEADRSATTVLLPDEY